MGLLHQTTIPQFLYTYSCKSMQTYLLLTNLRDLCRCSNISAILISLKKRALHKNIGIFSNFDAQIVKYVEFYFTK